MRNIRQFRSLLPMRRTAWKGSCRTTRGRSIHFPCCLRRRDRAPARGGGVGDEPRYGRRADTVRCAPRFYVSCVFLLTSRVTWTLWDLVNFGNKIYFRARLPISMTRLNTAPHVVASTATLFRDQTGIECRKKSHFDNKLLRYTIQYGDHAQCNRHPLICGKGNTPTLVCRTRRNSSGGS